MLTALIGNVKLHLEYINRHTGAQH